MYSLRYACTMATTYLYHLGIADYTVFVLILILSLTIGLYNAFHGKKGKSLQEYLVANREMATLPVAMSMLATFYNAMTILSLPAEIYMYNAGVVYLISSMFIALPVVCFCFLPTFYELKITSVYEYLEKRFNRKLRKLGSIIAMIQMLIFTSLMLYAPTLVLNQVTGLNFWWSVAAIGFLGTLYTSLGGFKAIIWTDVFQLFIIILALFAYIAQGVVDVGGLSHVFKKGWEGGRLELSFDLDLRVRYTFWSVSFAGIVQWLSWYGVGQMFVQRYVSAASLRKAQYTLLLNVLGNVFYFFCMFLAGLVIYAKYWDCDPILTKRVRAPDQLLPLFVSETLHGYYGLHGLFIGGLFCASLSTISSAINSMAAMLMEDFIKDCAKFKNMTSEKATQVSKIASAVFGITSIALIPVFANLGPIIQTNAYNSHTFAGITVGLFVLGLFVPWANSFGASVGAIIGLVLSQWISIGAQLHPPYTPRSPRSVEGCFYNFTAITNTSFMLQSSDVPPFYQIAFGWIMFVAFVPVVAFGMLFSAMHCPTKLSELDMRLLSPVVRRLIEKFYGDTIRSNVKFIDVDQVQVNLLSQRTINNSAEDEAQDVNLTSDTTV